MVEHHADAPHLINQTRTDDRPQLFNRWGAQLDHAVREMATADAGDLFQRFVAKNEVIGRTEGLPLGRRAAYWRASRGIWWSDRHSTMRAARDL